MTFESIEGVPDSPTSEDARASLSLEFSDPLPVNDSGTSGTQLAELEIDTEAKAPTEISTDDSAFVQVDKGGPLSNLIEAGDAGPSAMIDTIVEADKAWMEPYNKITEIDGHRLMEQFQGSKHNVRLEISSLDYQEQMALAPALALYSNPNTEIPAEVETQVAQYPKLHSALNEFRSTISNPNLEQAFELRHEAVMNMGESIELREKYAQLATDDEFKGHRLPNGLNMTSTSIIFSTEKFALERFANGGYR